MDRIKRKNNMAIDQPTDELSELLDGSPTDEVPRLTDEDLKRLGEAAIHDIDSHPPAGPVATAPRVARTALQPSSTPAQSVQAPVVSRLQSLERVETEIQQLLSHWGDIEGDLKAQAAEIECLNAGLAARESDIARLDEALASAHAERDQAREEIRRVEAELARQHSLGAESEERARAAGQELRSLRDTVASLEQDILARDAARTDALGELERYRDALLGMQQTISKHEKATARRETEKAALAASVAGLQQQLATLNGRREESDAAAAKLQELLAQGHRELERLHGELRREQAARERQATELLGRDQALGELRGEVTALQAAAKALREEMTAREAAGETSRRQLEAAAQARIEQLTNSLREERTASGRLAEDLGQRNQRITDLQNALVTECENAEAGKRRFVIAEEQLARSLADATAREEDLRSQINNFGRIEERATANAREAELARGELSALESRLEASQAEVAERDRRLQELETRALAHAEALAAANTGIDSAAEERKRLQAELAERDLELSHLHAALSDMANDREAARGELLAQHAAMEELQAQLRSNLATIATLDADARRLGEIENHMQTLDARMADHLGPRRRNGAELTRHEKGHLARLLVLLQGEHPVKHPIYKPNMVIGRGPDTDIQVPGRFASRRHARIYAEGDEIYVEDLGSMNGISVNAKVVRRQRLHDGDVLDVGGSQLRFVDPAERQPEDANHLM
jgi:chromosome segregation ATPase